MTGKLARKAFWVLIATLLVLGASPAEAVPLVIWDINKDIIVLNQGIEPASELDVLLAGQETIIWHYDGYPERHFNTFEPLPYLGHTLLRWSDLEEEPGGNNLLDPDEQVHVGWGVERPPMIIKDAWLADANGDPIPGIKLWNVQAGITFSDGELEAKLCNTFEDPETGGRTLLIDDVRYVILDEEVPLDELNAQNEWLDQLLGFPINDLPIEIPSGGCVYILLSPGLPAAVPLQWVEPGDFVVLNFTVTDDQNDVRATDWVQFYAVPEPATITLLGLGGLGILIRRRKRK